MKRSGAIGNKVAVTRRHIGEYDANRRLDIRDIRKITKDVILVNNEVSTKIWGCSSAGRAPALQAGGQRFDSAHLHQKRRYRLYGSAEDIYMAGSMKVRTEKRTGRLEELN